MKKKEKKSDDNDTKPIVKRKGSHLFQPGNRANPNGRPKGSRNKLSEDFLKDFHNAWKEHGNCALKKMATEKPAEFVKAAVQLMPRDLHVKADASEAFVKIWEAIANNGSDELAEGLVIEQEQPCDIREARPKGNA